MVSRDKLFDSMMGASVDYNLEDPQNYGIAFREDRGIWCAVVASPCYVAEIRNVPPPQGEFFSFFENTYTKYQFPIPINKLIETLYTNTAVPIGEIITKNANFLDYLGSIPKIKRERSRLILYPAEPVRTDEPVMAFKDIEGKKIFASGAIDKPFIAVEDAPIPASKLDKGFYRCEIVDEQANCFYVRALRRFGALNLDLIYTPGIYVKDKLPERNPAECFAFPVFKGDLGHVTDIHIDTNVMFAVMKMFLVLKEDTDVRISICEDPHQPVIISGDDGETEIILKLQPLNREKDMQWR